MSTTPAIEARIADLAQLSIARSKPKPTAVRRFSWKLLLLLVGASGASVLTWFVASSVTAAKPVAVQTAVAESTTSDAAGAVLSGSGYVVTARSYVTLGTLISGQIVDEPIEEGQRVRKGDLIARINDADYLAHLSEAKADYERAQAEVELADQRMARMQQLYSAGVVSRDEYDAATSSQQISHASLARSRATVAFAESQVKQCTIRSPINGVVLRKFHDVGSTINYSVELQSSSGSTDIAKLADTDDLRVELDISESDISKIHVGMPASVVLDAYPDHSFDAKVVKIYPEANRQKASITIEARLLRPDLALIRPEMSAKVSFLSSPSNHKDNTASVVVPKAALVKSDDGSYVWVVSDGRAQKIRVEAGRDVSDNVEIRQGLSGAETVIVDPSRTLAEGQPVSEKNATE